MLFQGASQPPVTVLLGGLESQAARIEKRRQGGVEEAQAQVAVESLQQVSAIIGALHRLAVRLPGDPHHEEEVDAVDAVLQGAFQGGFYFFVAADELSVPFTQLFEVRLQCHLQTELGNRLGDDGEIIVSRWIEELEDQLVLDSLLGKQIDEALEVLFAALSQVVDEENRGSAELLNQQDVLDQGLGRPERRFAPVEDALVGKFGAAADRTIERAAPRGEQRRDGVIEPVHVRYYVGEATVLEHRSHPLEVI